MAAATTFRTEVLSNGKTATGVRIPAEVVEALDAGKKPPVRVTISDVYTYRSTVATRGGAYLLGISAQVREEADVAAGDMIDITLELDTEPRVIEVPDDLAAALIGSARERFDALSYSGKQRYVLPIEQAKTDATRQRRIDKVLAELG